MIMAVVFADAAVAIVAVVVDDDFHRNVYDVVVAAVAVVPVLKVYQPPATLQQQHPTESNAN